MLYYWLYHPKSFFLLVITLIIKITLSFLLLYLVVNRWDFGDLPTYYTLSHQLKTADYTFMTGSLLIAQLHSFIFLIFGTSLYGLTLLSACISHLAITLMANVIFSSSELRKKNNAIFFINMLPTLCMQSTYIGREPWILLVTAILLYHLDTRIFLKLFVIVLVAFVFLTRPYQGAVLSVSFFWALVLHYKIYNWKILLLIFMSIPFLLYLILQAARRLLFAKFSTSSSQKAPFFFI